MLDSTLFRSFSSEISSVLLVLLLACDTLRANVDEAFSFLDPDSFGNDTDARLLTGCWKKLETPMLDFGASEPDSMMCNSQFESICSLIDVSLTCFPQMGHTTMAGLGMKLVTRGWMRSPPSLPFNKVSEDRAAQAHCRICK